MDARIHGSAVGAAAGAAAGAADGAAASAAAVCIYYVVIGGAKAAAVCIHYVVIGGRFAPPFMHMIKYIQQQQQQQKQQQPQQQPPQGHQALVGAASSHPHPRQQQKCVVNLTKQHQLQQHDTREQQQHPKLSLSQRKRSVRSLL